MEVVERNNVKRPKINLLGRLTRKSISEKRVVRIDRNSNSDVVDVNSENALNTAKIVNAISFWNTGMPDSFFPPGTVIDAANTTVTINAAVMLDDSAVVFIQVSPCINKSWCSLVKTFAGVSL
ncbi:hypothetical protein Hanom_Chr07g00653271 [Helianthus anomalus]